MLGAENVKGKSVDEVSAPKASETGPVGVEGRAEVVISGPEERVLRMEDEEDNWDL